MQKASPVLMEKSRSRKKGKTTRSSLFWRDRHHPLSKNLTCSAFIGNQSLLWQYTKEAGTQSGGGFCVEKRNGAQDYRVMSWAITRNARLHLSHIKEIERSGEADVKFMEVAVKFYTVAPLGISTPKGVLWKIYEDTEIICL